MDDGYSDRLLVADQVFDGGIVHSDFCLDCFVFLVQRVWFYRTAQRAVSYTHLREEGKKKWDAQRSMKFVNKLKRKKAIGTLQSLVPPAEAPAGETSSAAPAADGSSDASIL